MMIPGSRYGLNARRTAREAALALAALLVSAAAPATPAPAAPAPSASRATQASPARVMSLRQALETAMNNSPSIIHSRLRLEGSEARLRAQEAGLKTQLKLTLNPITYTNRTQFNDYFATWYTSETKSASGTFTVEQPLKWTDGTLSLNNDLSWLDSKSGAQDEQITTYQNQLYLSYVQPLFSYNRMKMDLEELELEFENRRLQFSIDRLSIEQRVVSAFFQVYRIKMQLEIARDALAIDTEHLEIIRNKYEAGLGSLDDLSQAQVSMLSSEMNYRNTQVSLAAALDNFKNLIGMPIDDEIDIDESVAFAPVGVEMSFAERHGLENRLELHQRRIDILRAYNAVVRAGTTNEFRGNLVLSYGTTGTSDEFGSIYDKPAQNQHVSVSFDIPLWDWGRRRNTIRASETNLESGRQSLDDERNGIAIEIRDSYRQLENLVHQIELARARVESAERAYDISLERYRIGTISSKDLGEYRQSLSSARMNEVNALIDYRLQLLDIKIKTLWDFERDRSALEP